MTIGLVPKAQMNYNYTVKMQLYNVDKGAFVFVGFLAKQLLDTEDGCVSDRERSLLEGLLQRLPPVVFVGSLHCLLLSAAVLQRAFFYPEKETNLCDSRAFFSAAKLIP